MLLFASPHPVEARRDKGANGLVGLRNASDESVTAPSGAGVVVIGRNEGERLINCFKSLPKSVPVVYVDSGSTDGSVQSAKLAGVEVVILDLGTPFTAARARNVGFKRLTQIAPAIRFVQFIDGDCELARGWLETAVPKLSSCSRLAAVCGRRREKFPDRSIYNWLCDQEWGTAVGEVPAFGGDVLIRTAALEEVSGFRSDLIAGEEPELCVRLRRIGWRIYKLGTDMTYHDAAMTRFSQWWRRAERAGYAFAQGALLHGATDERHYVWESARSWIWAGVIPACWIICVGVFGAMGALVGALYPLQVIRQTIRNEGSVRARVRLGTFQVLARFPELFGQMKFLLSQLRLRRGSLIEYK